MSDFVEAPIDLVCVTSDGEEEEKLNETFIKFRKDDIVIWHGLEEYKTKIYVSNGFMFVVNISYFEFTRRMEDE